MSTLIYGSAGVTKLGCHRQKLLAPLKVLYNIEAFMFSPILWFVFPTITSQRLIQGLLERYVTPKAKLGSCQDRTMGNVVVPDGSR